ncbi:MAG: COX15/CtaA family protein [Gemmatimonadota bacterium]
MSPRLHRRAFVLSLPWTLGLLLLGSVVHATESSLACPDWPTCYGTMVPVMEGGIFWEHLHRLVAGGLLLLWGAGTWFAFREPGVSRAVRSGAVAGLGLLLVQSVFGGLTVLFKLPDAVSTTHLGLAFLFLSLATWLAVVSRSGGTGVLPEARREVRFVALTGAALVFVQSLLGAAVRHTDSGLACPDIPLCIGEWVPPLDQWPIALHWTHRLVAVLTAVFILYGTARVWRAHARGAAGGMTLASVLVLTQVGLGFLSVHTFLAVVPVSLHTVVAAGLLATLVGTAATTVDRDAPAVATPPERALTHA